MPFNSISSIMSTGATVAERINVIASEVQDVTTGIIDGPTGTQCNSAYWERVNGAFDSIIALYDVLSGRDTSGTLDILGNVNITNGYVTIGSSMTVNGITALSGVVSGTVGSYANITGANLTLVGSAAGGDSILKTSRVMLTEQLNNDGIWYEESFINQVPGVFHRVIYFENGSLKFRLPYTPSEYVAAGAAGAAAGHFRNSCGGITNLDINMYGSMRLGSGANGDQAPVGINIVKLDANGSNGSTYVESSTLPSDERQTSSFLITERNRSLSAPLTEEVVEISLNALKSGLSNIDFSFNGLSVFNFNENGASSFGSISALSDISAGGALNVSGTSNLNSVNINATLSSNFSFFSPGSSVFIGPTSFMQQSGGVKFGAGPQSFVYINASNNTESFITAIGSDGATALNIGFSGSTVPSLFSNAGLIDLHAGSVGGAPLNELWLRFLEVANGGPGGIAWHSATHEHGLFVDSDGIVRTVADPRLINWAIPNVGEFNVPKNMVAADLQTGSLLNFAANQVCSVSGNSFAILKDINAGYMLATNDNLNPSWNWELIRGDYIGSRILSAVTTPFFVENNMNRIQCGKSAVAAQSITISLSASFDGNVIRFKDGQGNASVNNITIQGTGSQKIDGNPTYVINTDYGSVTMYFFTGQWYTQ